MGMEPVAHTYIGMAITSTVTIDSKGLLPMTANAGPSSDHVAAMLSRPVCGVATKKEVDAARDAPLRRMEMAAGSTPQEHNGKGMPTAADFTTNRQPVPAKWRANLIIRL